MNIFIVGAGFTKAVFPDAPLNRDLLKALAGSASDSPANVLRERYKTDDIEIALTRLDADISALQSKAQASASTDFALRSCIEAELSKYFAFFVASDQIFQCKPWLVDFLDHVFAPGDVIISLNYDCVLEGALDYRGKWSPKGGYGAPFDHPLVCDDEYPKSPVTVLKIHGSANFVIAPYLDKPDAKAVNFIFSEHFFPRSAKDKHFGYGAGTGRNYLIAPSYVKVPTVEIAYLMNDALAASTSARNLVLVGTSMRPEDAFLTVILTNFLRQPSWRDRRVLIVDPAPDAIANRLKNFWGVNVATQIVSIEGGLEASVPRLIEGIMAT